VAPSYGPEMSWRRSCAGATHRLEGACKNTGVTPAYVWCRSAVRQCGQVIEGNSALTPEIAKTWSFV